MIRDQFVLEMIGIVKVNDISFELLPLEFEDQNM